MTREEAKELLPIIQAFAEGKIVQYKNSFDKWSDTEENEGLSFVCSPSNYRIKPEPKYRPFKNQEECWNEMLKHRSIGWIRYDDSICAVQNIAPEGITITDGIKISNFYFEECLMKMKFIDGTPFGIKEE